MCLQDPELLSEEQRFLLEEHEGDAAGAFMTDCG